MAFELKPRKSIAKRAQKVLIERLDKAIRAIGATIDPPSDKAVHAARKRIREVRAALRLIRSDIGERTFARENRLLRDATRPLSEVRDAKVLAEALDKLAAHFHVGPKRIKPIEQALAARRRDIRAKVFTKGHAVSPIVRGLRASRAGVAKWKFSGKGWSALGEGLEDVYRQGRRSMKAAEKSGRDEDMHEWRKRTKDLRHDLELLAPAWPAPLEVLARQANDLTDLLGEDHDLCVLSAVLAREFKGGSIDIELVHALIRERRGELQAEAFKLGKRVYEERPKNFTGRVGAYWRLARSE